jgi:hypothetical protein
VPIQRRTTMMTLRISQTCSVSSSNSVSTHWHHRHLVGWLIALGVGCSADFSVSVRGPSLRPLNGMYVEIADRGDEVCFEHSHGQYKTDEYGLARVHMAACGDYQLIVSGVGMRTHRQALDTCRANNVDVALKAARPAHRSDAACSTQTNAFIQAWLRQDHEKIKRCSWIWIAASSTMSLLDILGRGQSI